MIYRMRVYRAVESNLQVFNDFFEQTLLPIQLRHGARLVGRWQTDDGRIVGVWEYDNRDEYERISAAVAADPDAKEAQAKRKTLPVLFTDKEDVLMESTLSARQ